MAHPSRRQLRAARTLKETIVTMAATGKPLMARVLPRVEARAWRHYPEDDARDRYTGARWFYHSHEPADRACNEHGHFHLFLNLEQMSGAQAPLAIPAHDTANRAKLVHIAALSISKSGIPTGWFVTNRWVTDEFLFPAPEIIRRLTKFAVSRAPADRLVNRFLSSMVRLYSGEISRLLLERDLKLDKLRKALGASCFEQASGHEILACATINLDQDIAQIEANAAE